MTKLEEFKEYQISVLIEVVEEAKRLGIVKGFQYERNDSAFGERMVKISKDPDDWDVRCISFHKDGIFISDGNWILWKHGSGWFFDKKFIALNRLKQIDEGKGL
jgi:hypothetical protein